MNLDSFWELIGKVIKAGGDEPDEREAVLKLELECLSKEDLTEFYTHFSHCENEAYHWDLWAAAYIIGGGCSDDGFMDFRSSLILQGREIFEAALKDPDSLAALEFEDIEMTLFHEGYAYIPAQVFADKHNGEIPAPDVEFREGPEGEPWEEESEEDLQQICPELFEKYWDKW